LPIESIVTQTKEFYPDLIGITFQILEDTMQL